MSSKYPPSSPTIPDTLDIFNKSVSGRGIKKGFLTRDMEDRVILDVRDDVFYH